MIIDKTGGKAIFLNTCILTVSGLDTKTSAKNLLNYLVDTLQFGTQAIHDR